MTSFEPTTEKRYIVNVRESPELTRTWQFDTEALAISFAEWNQANGLASEVVEEATTVRCLARFGYHDPDEDYRPGCACGVAKSRCAEPCDGYHPGCGCTCDSQISALRASVRAVQDRREAPDRYS
jgi:hypothetical protein